MTAAEQYEIISRKTMGLRFLAVLLVMVFAVGPVEAAAPRRIVSINLCADQYLLALADRDQIVALSQYARDPTMSYAYRKAAGFPLVPGSAEAILKLKPDLVLGAPIQGIETRNMLRRFGLLVIDMGFVTTFDGIVAQTRQIAAAIGHPDRGEALIASMRARLAAIKLPAGPPLVAVHYQRQGYVTGSETLMDEIMRRAGLTNLARKLGDTMIAHVDLETILAARPDVIIFTDRRGRANDWGVKLLNHPALAHAFHGRMIYIPDTLTTCPGPSYPDAVEALYTQVHRVRG
jgi:iron complex transport system substrate-binding protein